MKIDTGSRAALLVGLALVALTGCSSGGSSAPTPSDAEVSQSLLVESEPTQTPAAPEPAPSATESPGSARDEVQKIGEKFPTEADLSPLYSNVTVCDTDAGEADLCFTDDGVTSFTVSAALPKDPSSTIPFILSFEVMTFDTDALKDSTLHELRARDESYQGAFDHAPDETGFGERGEGSFADFTWGDWKGTREDSKGEPYKADGTATRPMSGGHSVILEKDDLVLMVRISGEALTSDLAGTETDKYLTQILGSK